jgi:5'(3')-deoxyribonucleotidase
MKTIYVDTDGVLSDFINSVSKITGIPRKELDIGRSWPDEIWKKVSKHQDLYRRLDVHPGAYDLTGYLVALKAKRPFKLVNLTARPRRETFPTAEKDKKKWVAEKFFGVYKCIVCLRKEKQNYAKPGDILIDDTEKNCIEWRKAGGDAVLYKEFHKFVPAFEKLFYK